MTILLPGISTPQKCVQRKPKRKCGHTPNVQQQGLKLQPIHRYYEVIKMLMLVYTG